MEGVEQIGPIKRILLDNYVEELAAESVIYVHQIGKTLIDTGSIFTAKKLVDALRDDPPNRIVLSHQHEDHIGGVQALFDAFGEMDVFCPVKHVNIVTGNLIIPKYRQLYWGNPNPLKDVKPYSDGFSFEDLGVGITAIETPGHTVGHMAFVVNENTSKYILLGDLFISEKLYISFDESSVPDMLNSLQKILTFEDVLAILPSHHKIIHPPFLEIQNLIQWYLEEIEETETVADQISSRDYVRIFRHRFKEVNKLELFSRGSLGRLALLRGILEPVEKLPASPIRFEDLDSRLY